MEAESKSLITVKTIVNAPVLKTWEYWTAPEHIEKWNYASNDWHTPHAENDLRVGGKFLSRMEAKDGSAGFDFEGIYDSIKENEYIEYTIADGRKVKITFNSKDQQTSISETFEAETTNPVELQRGGWQAILDNFKNYTESH